MHELSLLSDIMRKIDQVVRDSDATRATRIKVRLGALSHISPEHFREHFDDVKPGTVAQESILYVSADTDETDPNAQQIMLESVEVE